MSVFSGTIGPGETMNQKIVIYGQGDKSELGFPNVEALSRFIKDEVASKNQCRYRFTEGKAADVIILSRDGLAYGHFEIEDKLQPTEQDRAEYPPVKCVYIVGRRALYAQPVRLYSIGIRVHQRGISISDAQFEEIKKLAGEVTIFESMIASNREA
jgi:hypothetical protein